MPDEDHAELIAAAKENACPYCVPEVRVVDHIGNRSVVAIYHRVQCPIGQRLEKHPEEHAADAAAFEARMSGLGYLTGADVPDHVPDEPDGP